MYPMWWFALFVLGGLYLPSDCSRSFIVKWHNFTVDVKSQKIASYNVILSNQNDSSTFDAFIIFSEMVDNVTFTSTFDILQTDGSLKRIFEYSLDMCKSFKMAYKKNIVTILGNEIKTMAHTPSYCPIPANENFTLNNYHVAAEQFPPYTPEFTFVFDVVFFINGEEAVVAKIVGAVESKQKRRQKIQ